MKPEAQNRAIAIVCGKNPDEVSSPLWGGHGINPEFIDYLNDLNAMAKAVLTLEAEQRARFVDMLLKTATPHPMHPLADFNALNATAAQRGEAFLRTLNLWTKD